MNVIERAAVLREANSEWNDGNGRWCRACKKSILPGDESLHMVFDKDPHGLAGLTGDYHAACGEPHAMLARALDELSKASRWW